MSFLVDGDGIVTFTNSATEHAIGIPAWDVTGSPFSRLISESDQFAAGWLLEAARNGYTPQPVRLTMNSRDGGSTIIEAIAENRLDDEAVQAIVISARDISNEVRLELERDAHSVFDHLTGVSNRTTFMLRLEQASARAARLGRPISLAILDINHFSLVNDTLGAEAGDHVLKTIAGRLQLAASATWTIGRLAGDRFAIVLEESEPATRNADVAFVMSAVGNGVAWFDRDVPISVRVGFTAREAGQRGNATDLVSEAEAALAHAKRSSSEQPVCYIDSMAAPLGRLSIEADLRAGIERREFMVHYQPVVSLEACEVVEMEALVRWNHPSRGLVSPADFIPIAEETGLIVPIGFWVLREACQQGMRWIAARPDRPITMSVNLSPRMFRQADLVEQVRSTLAATNFPPASLRLEITEGVMIEDRETATRLLVQLKAMGVQLAIDDFGTGYSSLSYLQYFPVDVIKIDRAFISTMATSRESTEIVRSIVDLAKALNMETTGEGIETEHQLAQLRELGSDRGQGFLFSRPMPASELDLVMASTTGVQFAA